MASVAQVRANRLNAQKSTGPRTPEGKAVVAQNAVKHGLLAQQVVIRGEDPGEFELFRDRMVQDLDPAGSLESLLAERVAHLGWRLRRAERFENAAWGTLEADYLAKASGFARAQGVGRPEGQGPDDEEAVLARVVVKDFGNAKVLDQLLIYERRIENSLYRTVGELQKRKKVRETDTPGAEEGGGTAIGEATTEKREDEPRSSEELGRGHPSYEEASHDATTNGTSWETKPMGSGADQGARGEKEEELGRRRPSYEEASDDATTNGAPVAPAASNLTLETSNSAAGRSCQTKPNEVSGGKCQVSNEQSQSTDAAGGEGETRSGQT